MAIKMLSLIRFDPVTCDLIRGTGLSFSLRIGGAGLGLVFNLILARYVGAEGVGLLFLGLTVVGLVGIVARLGLDSIIVREVAPHASAGQWAAVGDVAKATIRIGLISSLLCTLLLWLAAPVLADVVFSKPALAHVLYWLSLTVLPATLAMFYSELLRGAQRFIESQLAQVFITPLVTVFILFVAGQAFGLSAAMAAHIAGNIAALMLGYLAWRRLAASHGGGERTELLSSRLLRSGSPLLWVALLNTLVSTVDVLILGALGTAADVGVYGVAARLAMLTTFILLAVNSYAAPKFAVFHCNNDLAGLAQYAVRSTRLTLLIASPILFVLVAMPKVVLSLFGPQFEQGEWVLVILALGQMINVATGSVGQILIMTGNERILRSCSIASVLITVALNFSLIPYFGALGAAFSTMVGGVVLNILAMLSVRKKLGVMVHFLAPAFRQSIRQS
ncbi:MAG: flippase [Hydrogenophilales bacterium]|nr:flippase [Hydrogenophilales bacterium]